MNKNKIVILIIIVFVFLVGGGGYFYYSRILAVNYLISGVPYNGVYNLYFREANTSEISSVLDILDYWGDKRFSISDLRREFLYSESATSTVFSPPPSVNISEIQNFFIRNGYKTSGWLSVEASNVIKEIKQFVNSEKKVPVIILTIRTLDEKNNISLVNFQVVIGIFDNSQKVIVHDHYYGNNYEISYTDFTKMFYEEEVF